MMSSSDRPGRADAMIDGWERERPARGPAAKVAVGRIRSQDGRDRVDAMIERWKSERPDLDPSAKAVIGRILRLEGVTVEEMTRTFAPFGLSPVEYVILVTLRVSGKPYELQPKEIIQQTLLTSGAMTNILKRMEEQGLVARRPDRDDRRSVRVRLEQRGKEIIDLAMEHHARMEHRLVASLNKREQRILAGLLHKVLASLDRSR